MKFFIKVGPKQYDDVRREVCARDLDCWFKRVEKGRAEPLPSGLIDDPRWIGTECFTSDEITLRYLDDKAGRPYTFEGYGGVFSDRCYGVMPAEWFEFEPDRSFTRGSSSTTVPSLNTDTAQR